MPSCRECARNWKRKSAPTCRPRNAPCWDKYREDLDKYKKKKQQAARTRNRSCSPAADVDLRDVAEAKPDEIARRSAPAHRQEAMNLAKEIEHDEVLGRDINRERMKVNFDFWRTRAKAEQTAECLAARKAIHDGDQAFAKGDLIRARPKYEEGLRGWRKVLDDPEFQSLVEDPSLGGDLIDVIRRYEKCLAQDDQQLPESFILRDIREKHGHRGAPPPSPEKKDAPHAASSPDAKPHQP